MDCFVILHFISVDFSSWKSRTFQRSMGAEHWRDPNAHGRAVAGEHMWRKKARRAGSRRCTFHEDGHALATSRKK
jgi:hypothetical protein